MQIHKKFLWAGNEVFSDVGSYLIVDLVINLQRDVSQPLVLFT